jgi:uncharacterized protein (DUF305 family)
MSSSTDPLGVRQQDPLEKWRAEVEQQEREFAEARRQREAERQRVRERAASNDAEQLRRQFEERLAAVERANQEQDEDFLELMRATEKAVEAIEAMGDYVDRRGQREEIRSLRDEVATLRAMVTEIAKSGTFQFAREKTDDEPPGPPLPRRDLN